MTGGVPRVVYDCNVHLQALINESGPAGRCVQMALRGNVQLYWSAFVAEEFRRTAEHAWIREKFRHITPDRIDDYVINIEKVARTIDRVSEVFTYERDRDDAHYVNLALAADARLVVTRDKDLLVLMELDTPEGRDFASRFPHLQIMTPPAFLRHLDGTRAQGNS